MSISELIRDTIVGLCRANGPYNGQVEIDGIICISGPKEGQQLVIKVHECLEGFVKESMESWMGKKVLCKDQDQWSPPIKSETLGSRLPTAVSDEEQDGPTFESQIEDDRKDDFTRVAKSSTSGDSPDATSESGITDKNVFCMSLECKLCLKSFLDHESMEVHNELCHNLFTCHSCLKTFTSRSNLERHSRLHTGQKPYICNICDKAFSRKDHLSNHMTKHAFKCNSCSKKFGDCLSLASHFTYEHRMSLTHLCQLCNEGFGSLVAYEDHLSLHPECQPYNLDQNQSSLANGHRKLSCQLCSFSTSDALVFYRHRLSHMFNNKSQYSCLFCNKHFDDMKSFMEHSMEHQNMVASQTLHINWLQHFSNHYHSLLMASNSETYHNSNNSQATDDYQMEHSNRLRNHSVKVPSEHESVEKRLKRKQERSDFVDLSSKFYSRNGEHISSESPGVVPNKVKKVAPNRHLSEPAGFMANQFQNNGDSFLDAFPINLKIEKSFENDGHGSEPQQCGICQRWFSCFEVLDSHCLEEHNRSACMFCSKTFAQRANRDRHLCLHTGKKPYSCSDCDEKFSRGDKLKMHRIKVHGAIYPSRMRDIDSGSWSGGSMLRNQELHPHASPGLADVDVFESNGSSMPMESNQQMDIRAESESDHVEGSVQGRSEGLI